MPPRIESEQAQTKPEPHLQETLEVVPRPRTFNKLTNLLLVMAIVAGTFTGYLLSVNINSKAAGIPGTTPAQIETVPRDYWKLLTR